MCTLATNKSNSPTQDFPRNEVSERRRQVRLPTNSLYKCVRCLRVEIKRMERLAPGVSEMIDEAVSKCKIPLAPMPMGCTLDSSKSDGSVRGGNVFVALAATADATASVVLARKIQEHEDRRKVESWLE